MIVRKVTNYVIEIDDKIVTLTEEHARSLMKTLQLEFGEDKTSSKNDEIEKIIDDLNKSRDIPNPWDKPHPWDGWPPTITFKSASSR